MGNSLKKNEKNIIFCVSFLLIILGVYAAYKPALSKYNESKIGYDTYNPKTLVTSEVDTSKIPPAKSVPILLYHGVIKNYDGSNTTYSNFVADMEMLKRQGYQTISISEMDQAFHGKFTLPPKPIIITFDDGRKDSFYPTDDVLKKLGFKASIFIATIKANDEEPFYLSWDELKNVEATGRWEIEAHGRNSHEMVPIDADGHTGRFLTSLQYLPSAGRLETIKEFETRVEQDYMNGIDDLKNNLGIDPVYFAVPLNDYGNYTDSNYYGSLDFNQKMTAKYFRYSFVEANDSTDPTQVLSSLYNFADDNPYTLRRLEVKNMSAEDLKNLLIKWQPGPAKLSIKSNTDFQAQTQKGFGKMVILDDGLHLVSTPENVSALSTFGDLHWHDYSVSANMERISGRSMVLLAYYTDKDNYLSAGVTDKGLFLRQSVNGVEKDLSEPINVGYADRVPTNIKLSIYHSYVSLYWNGQLMIGPVYTSLKNGSLGFKVWDDQGSGESVLTKLTVAPI